MKFARVLSVLFATMVVVLASAGSALASTMPITWETGPERSMLEILAIYVAVPVVLFAVIWVFGAATSRNNHTPPAPSTELEKADGAH